MDKKPHIKLPKSVKKSGKKVQEKYIKAYLKSIDKHGDAERAREKAFSKLEKKYVKVDKHWVHKDDVAPAKNDKKAEKPAKKSEKSDKKSDKKKAESKKSKKPKGSKKASKDKKKSKSDDLLLEILSAEDFDPDEMLEVLEERVEDGENLTVEEASEEMQAMEDELLGLDESEEALAEPNLAEALEEEPSGDVQPEENTVTTRRLISDVTRAELYKEAQALKIPGRSSMSKEELFTAIELAR